MARIQGLVGGMSGKMGNAVFRQRYGQTIVSQYQPVVTNPNTSGQQVARAKFKLITQLAAIMSPAMGSFIIMTRGEKSKKKTKNNAFVQRNYALMTPGPSAAAAEKVTIPMNQLQLTDSVDYLGTIDAVKGDSNTKLDVNIIAPKSANSKKAKIVLVGYGTMGAINRPSRARVISIVDVPFVPAGDNEVKLQHTFDVKQGEDYTVLAYGMEEITEGSQSLDYDNIHTPADDDYISQVNIERAVSEGSMRLTETIGVNYTAPTE